MSIPAKWIRCMCGALLALSVAYGQKGDSPETLLQAAIKKEVVDGDLKGAVEIYKQALARAGSNRPVAAKALVQMGMCFEKLGMGEARAAYERLIAEYGDQKQEVTLAQERLAVLSKSQAEIGKQPTFRKIRIPGKPPLGGGGVLSPDGRRLAFAADKSVWVVELKGNVDPNIAGEATRLSGTEGATNRYNIGMAWSADGRWIGFRKGTFGDIHIIPASGGEVKVIADTGKFAMGSYALSPDGKLVAFPNLKDGRDHIFTVSTATGERSQFTPEVAAYPSYSPDGKHIAYKQNNAVWIAPSAGGSARLVCRPDGFAGAPVWSPDGRMLVFTVFHAMPGVALDSKIWITAIPEEGKPAAEPVKINLPWKSPPSLAGWSSNNRIGMVYENPYDEAVYTVPPAGGRAIQVTAIGARQPRWSPRGDRIYYRGQKGLEFVPAEGGKGTALAISPPIVPFFPGGSNSISPDGKQILFAGAGYTARGAQIYVMPADGGTAVQISASEPGGDHFPCWSPDGSQIAFLRILEIRPQRLAIFIIPASGGNATQIASTDADQLVFAPILWSRDGKSIAYFGSDKTIRAIPAAGGPGRVIIDISRHWPSEPFQGGLAFSPDEKRLAFMADWKLWIATLAEGQMQEVNTGLNARVTMLDWSPDGERIAFTGVTGGEEEFWLVEDFLPLLRK